MFNWFDDRLSRRLCDLRCEQHASAQEVKVGAAIHLAFDLLEAGDLSFGLAVAPRRGERRPNGGVILPQSRGEGLDGSDAAGADIGEPGLEACQWSAFFEPL